MWRIEIVLIGCLVLAAGCGNDLAGSYTDNAGVTRYDFRPDGSARISVLGSTVSAEYTVDGKRVIVTSPQGTVVLRRESERLYGPMGLELVRQAE